MQNGQGDSNKKNILPGISYMLWLDSTECRAKRLIAHLISEAGLQKGPQPPASVWQARRFSTKFITGKVWRLYITDSLRQGFHSCYSLAPYPHIAIQLHFCHSDV